MKNTLKLTLAALLAAGAMAVQASPVAIHFTVSSSTGGSIVGGGTAITDTSHLDAGDFTTNPADLLAMTMSLSGIPTAPSTTSFTKADLSSFEWILQVDGAGVISDLNFFMRGGAANADGYSIEGISPFNSVFCHGTAVVNACAGAAAPTEIDRLVIHVTDIGTVPEPLSLALVGLGLAGVGVSRRKKA